MEREPMHYRPQKPTLKLPDDLKGLRDTFTKLSKKVQEKRGVSKAVVQHSSSKNGDESPAELEEQERKRLRRLCAALHILLQGKPQAHQSYEAHKKDSGLPLSL